MDRLASEPEIVRSFELLSAVGQIHFGFWVSQRRSTRRRRSSVCFFFCFLTLLRYEDFPYLPLSLALSKCDCAIGTAKQEDMALHQAEKEILPRVSPSQRKKILSLLPMARLYLDYREHFRHLLLRILLPIHRAILQVGRRAAGSIRSAT